MSTLKQLITEQQHSYPSEVYWFHRDFGMSIGIELRNDPSDRARKSLANAAKETRIIPWLASVKSRLTTLKYNPIDVDVVFTSRKVEGGNLSLGRAVQNPDGTFYFALNVDCLSGKLNFRTKEAIDAFVHEWSHVWMFENETPSIRKKLVALLNTLRSRRKEPEMKKVFPINGETEYALSHDSGDELWAYMNERYDELSQPMKNIYWKLRK